MLAWYNIASTIDNIHTRVNDSVVLDFGSGSGKCGIRPLFRNLANSSSSQISSQIWQMEVQLLYVQLITDKTNAADLSSGVFATQTKSTKSTTVPQISSKTGKKWRNKGSTELCCVFIAADSIADATSFIRRIVLWSKNDLSQIQIWLWSDLIWVPKSGQVRLQPDLNPVQPKQMSTYRVGQENRTVFQS